MTPLRIEAILSGGICLPNGPIALDALLMAAVGLRDGLPPPASAHACLDLPIPIAKSECERLYLASLGHFEVEARESEYTNRRFPLAEAQELGGAKLRRIQINAGPSKSYRIPRERLHLTEDRMTWWAVGDADGVRDLLTEWVYYLGKRRGVGLGKVREWRVSECEPWGDGFPVARDGAPTRPLPIDWPGVDWGASERAYAAIKPPYWAHHRREECLVPTMEP